MSELSEIWEKTKPKKVPSKTATTTKKKVTHGGKNVNGLEPTQAIGRVQNLLLLK